eukprot:Gb_22456 [translate_table: standard]
MVNARAMPKTIGLDVAGVSTLGGGNPEVLTAQESPFIVGPILEEEEYDQLSESEYIKGTFEHEVDQMQIMMKQIKREQSEMRKMVGKLVNILTQMQVPSLPSIAQPVATLAPKLMAPTSTPFSFISLPHSSISLLPTS